MNDELSPGQPATIPPVAPKRGGGLSDGVVVSVLTALAYLISFTYEAGTAHAFGIPVELIDLQLIPSLFNTLISLSVLLYLLQFADSLLAAVIPKSNDHPLLRPTRLLAAAMVIGVAFLLVGGYAIRSLVLWRVVWAALFFAALPLLLSLIMPLVMLRRHPATYAAKLSALAQADAEYQRPLNEILFRSKAPWIAGTVLMAMLLAGFSFMAGFGQAKQRKVFFVTNQKPETVVLRIYGDRVITAELVRSERKVKQLYTVMKLDTPNLTLRQESVGPLWLGD